MKQKLMIFTLALFIVGCASVPRDMSGAYTGQLVSVVESPDVNPPTVPPTGSIANGGFFIGGYGRGSSIGGGGDENTAWFHSFRIDRAQWEAFEAAAPEVIRSARLELIYTPRDSDSYNANDYILITGLKGIPINDFDGFPGARPSSPPERVTVSIELLADDRYSSDDILNVLKYPFVIRPDLNGVILMRYADDAIIHYSKLTLTY